MRQRWFPWLVFAFCAIASWPIQAQQANKLQLQKLSDSLRLVEINTRARLNSTSARVNLLPPYSSDGTHFLLVDINKFGSPVYRMTLNAGAAKTTGADVLQSPAISGLNVTGRDILFGVWDGGRVKDHIELGDRLVSADGEEFNSHATHVTGTLIAQGVNPNAKGMAPAARASTQYFANDLAVISALAAGESPFIISNHSYGEGTGWIRDGNNWIWSGNAAISATEDYRFGLYGARASIVDQIAYLAPYYSIFWAVGNDRSDTGDGSRPADCNGGTGYDCIIPDAVGKNIFTIGAVNKVAAYINPSSVVMGTYSSWGPTDDGRIKPDLVAAGTDLFSLSAAGTNTYEVLGGTSMATPNAAGSLGLLQQLHFDLHGGQFMKSSTLKALAIHTAKEAGPFAGPDYSYGWGLVDVVAAADILMKENNVDKRVEELTLLNGQKYELVITPAVGKKITATIAWTDPAAAPTSESLDPTTLALVNDLDIRIVDDAGVEQKPWILDPLNPVRQATRGDNFRDNVEKIEFNSPSAARYRVVVTHKGQLKSGSQDFALVLTYQDAAAPSTYYWVGNSGNWADGSHWSLSTGGAPANKVPQPADRVIFDENSFSIDLATVSCSADQACASLTWTTSRNASINLTQHTLSITSQLRVQHSNNFVENGTVLLKSTSTGRVDWRLPSSPKTNLSVESGSWDVFGSAYLGELTLKAPLTVHDGFLGVRQVSASSNLSLQSAKMEVRDQVSIPPGTMVGNGKGSELSILGTTEQSLSGFDWTGTIRVEGNVRLKGASKVGSVIVNGSCSLESDNTVGMLSMSPGSQLSVAGGSIQTVDSLMISSLPGKRVQLTTTNGSSFLSLARHRRYCFDYVDVTGVAVFMATINAGPNSTTTRAPGWQTVPCEQMWFADFTWSYACSNALTEFKNQSTGTPDGWSWSMNGLVHVLRADKLTDQNPFFAFPGAGTYPVSLTILKGNEAIDVVEKQVVVAKNYLDENVVIASGSVLQSKNVGTRYQWLVDGEPILGAVNRTLDFGGVPGIYQVAAYDQTCNALSKPFLVTGVNPGDVEITVVPNPASSRIDVVGVDADATVFAIDMTGRQREIIDGRISDLPSALYLLKIVTGDRTYFRKLVVAR